VDGAVTLWEACRRFIPDTPDTPHSLIEQRLLEQRAQLWPGRGCAGVTEVTDDNKLHVWQAGGSMAGLLDMLESVEWFALLNGLDGVVLGGRKGWHRVLKRYGYAPEGDEMVKVFR